MSDTRTVTALFVRRDSIYKQMVGVDAWDEYRDARLWTGGTPIVAHPPCAQWCRLRVFAKHDPQQKELALLAVNHVRRYGGVLEHPAHSTLWPTANLPQPGQTDKYSGMAVALLQFWFGYPANKTTWLYIVGCHWSDLPTIPLVLGHGSLCVGTSRGTRGTREMPKSLRTKTNRQFAEWLVAVARRCR